mgnify:CR=1 FL=1
MSRYFKQKKEHVLLKDLFLPLASFVLIVALFSAFKASPKQPGKSSFVLRNRRFAVRRCSAMPSRGGTLQVWNI